jgi:DNA-binding winged helix-turn-helix (wHTH) protein/tetratricopeptide (TPR) repeat protein
MEGSSDGFRAAPAVDLAHIRPFHIGSAEVRPASREVACGSLRESLEPRVMQVLVTLARARGAILSRDDLIAACWDGRAVSDDAINRVLSRLRALARKFEAFQIETVVKVGYRLVGQVEGLPAGLSIWAQVEELPGRALGRRGLIAGSAAAVLIGTAGFLSWRPWQHRPPREAVDLFRRGEMAQREGMLDQTRQAISFFEQAVKIDPSYAEAWGALSLSYDHLLEGSSDPETVSLPARIRSAAGRALQLDPDNADAQLALVSIPPTYRHWVSKESALRRLAERFPRHWLVQGRMAVLLYQVGRLNDGFEFHKKALAIDPMLPIAYATLAQAMASAGRLQEAQALLDQAHERWPAHPILWQIHYDYLLFSGRPESAAAFIMDPDSLPSGFGPAEVNPRLSLARAVETRQLADIEASIDDYRRMAQTDVANIPYSAAIFSLLGRLDLTFGSLERYYFNSGRFGAPSAPIGPYTRRSTDFLFAPAMAPARSDPRFTDLVRRIGLEAYWIQTGSTPDYRRQTPI